MSKRFNKGWILLAVLIVSVAIACLLSYATPDRVDTPQPIECPYQTDTPTCSEMDR